MNDIKEKRFLVMGTGRSGLAAARLLLEQKISVRLCDGNAEFDREAFYAKNPDFQDVGIILGELPEEEAKRTDILVLSPGVPADHPDVCRMRGAGVSVWGEIELAYAFSKGSVLAITGTNGKTTTTTLLSEILKKHFKDVRTVGNIGIPYSSVALDTTEETVIAAEISSFQLETVHRFAPKVSAILNITPDHLNRHHTMENYIAAKERITENQTKEDLCVLNYEDCALREFAKGLAARVSWFSSARRLDDGFYLKDGAICFAKEGKETELVRTKELKVLGRHNYENVMAASAMALWFGVPLCAVREALQEFQAVEHRIEYVTEKRGVAFYNDSKATNPDAAIQGVSAMNRPTFLIGGGCDKGSSYDAWIDAFGGNVKELVLIGETRDAIAEAARRRGFTKIQMADSLEEAVQICYGHAASGEAVLLSPACASFGMFTDYEERGRIFKEIARGLKE